MHDYLVRAKELAPIIIQNRRIIHHHPELGMNLETTAAFVRGKLEEMGYQPQEMGRVQISL